MVDNSQLVSEPGVIKPAMGVREKDNLRGDAVCSRDAVTDITFLYSVLTDARTSIGD